MTLLTDGMLGRETSYFPWMYCTICDHQKCIHLQERGFVAGDVRITGFTLLMRGDSEVNPTVPDVLPCHRNGREERLDLRLMSVLDRNTAECNPEFLDTYFCPTFYSA
jgi:hypothetical protein